MDDIYLGNIGTTCITDNHLVCSMDIFISTIPLGPNTHIATCLRFGKFLWDIYTARGLHYFPFLLACLRMMTLYLYPPELFHSHQCGHMISSVPIKQSSPEGYLNDNCGAGGGVGLVSRQLTVSSVYNAMSHKYAILTASLWPMTRNKTLYCQ